MTFRSTDFIMLHGLIIISIIGDAVKLRDILYLDLVFLQLVTQRVTTTINVMGGFQLLDLIIRELKSHVTCYNSMPLIG